MKGAVTTWAVCVLALSACGTTVQLADAPGAAAPSSSSELSLDLPSGAPSAALSPSQHGTAPGPHLVPTSAGTRSAGNPTPPTNLSGVPSATSAPHDHSPVEIGFLVSQDAGKAVAALGYGGLSTGDGTRQAGVITSLVNARGGLGGHPIKPVIYAVNPTGNSSQFQSACSTFFDDHKVRAVIGILLNDVVLGCTRQHDVPYVASAISTADEKTLLANPQLVIPNQPTYERGTKELVDSLVAQGWFRSSGPTDHPVIGLITHDWPAFAKVPGIVRTRLAAAGLSLKDVGYMPFDQDSGDLAKAATTGQGIALKFHSEGINRVVVVDDHGFAASWFAIGAGVQGYYPRFGFSTFSEPSIEPSVLSPRQLQGSAGVGWAPYLDTSVQYQTPISRRTTLCLNAMRNAGETTSLASVRLAAQSVCEGGFTLGDAWRGRPLTLSSFRQGLAALGSHYESVAVLGVNFARSRAAVSSQRALHYVPGCDCFRYSGPLRPFS
jgi:hypothetical protein